MIISLQQHSLAAASPLADKTLLTPEFFRLKDTYRVGVSKLHVGIAIFFGMAAIANMVGMIVYFSDDCPINAIFSALMAIIMAIISILNFKNSNFLKNRKVQELIARDDVYDISDETVNHYLVERGLDTIQAGLRADNLSTSTDLQQFAARLLANPDAQYAASTLFAQDELTYKITGSARIAKLHYTIRSAGEAARERSEASLP